MITESPATPMSILASARVAREQDNHLDEALERVFQKYGSDLSAFLKDVTDEMSAKQQSKIDYRAVRLPRKE